MGTNPRRRATQVAQQTSRVVLVVLPVVVGLACLRLLPAASLTTTQPATGWRFDPLALIGCAILLFATARLQPFRQGLRTTGAAAGLMVALLSTSPALQLLSLVLVSLLIFDGLGPRWFIALALFAFATLGAALLEVPPWLTLHATILMAFIGSGGLPWPGKRDRGSEIVFRSFWLFVMLRTLTFEPWPVSTVVVATALVSVALAGTAYAVVRAIPAAQPERASATLLMMAFVAIAQNTILGIVAALWSLAMCAVLVAMGPMKSRFSLTTICLIFFVAAWWTTGALAAAGGFLGALVACFASVAVCIAALLSTGEHTRSRPPISGRLFPLLLVAVLALATPWLTTTLALPVAQQLGAGLTAPGLLDIWPFIGVSALDAGHRQVTLMPSVVLSLLFVFILAVVWLVSRVRRPLQSSPAASPPNDAPRIIHARVWWLR